MNIGIRCAFEPRGVHAQHHLDAVSVLLGATQSKYLPSMSCQLTEEMPRMVGPTPSNVECLDALPSASG